MDLAAAKLLEFDLIPNFITCFNLFLLQVRDLGEGAFAKVVHCKLKREHGEPDMDVAVKLLKPALFNSDLDVSDFVKEGIVLKRMRHLCDPSQNHSEGELEQMIR